MVGKMPVLTIFLLITQTGLLPHSGGRDSACYSSLQWGFSLLAKLGRSCLISAARQSRVRKGA